MDMFTVQNVTNGMKLVKKIDFPQKGYLLESMVEQNRAITSKTKKTRDYKLTKKGEI
jgi:hypothetical protein